METNNIFDGAFDRMMEDEAWQRLSSSYPFSTELLEQYKDRLDWHSPDFVAQKMLILQSVD